MTPATGMPDPPSTDHASLPRYVQVESSLRALLETGGYRPGDKLPPEPALAKQLGVSRATLREALRSFEQQGIIRRKQGAGTFLNSPPAYVESGLEVLESIEMLLASRNIQPMRKDVHAHPERALPKAASRLKLAENAPVTTLYSTYMIQGRPGAYLLEVVPARLLSPEAAQTQGRSLLDFLLSAQFDHPLIYSISHIAPVLGTAEIARALDVGEQMPLYFLEQTVFGQENRPLYYARNYYVPQIFNFHIVRRV